jgi:hypothetical protein
LRYALAAASTPLGACFDANAGHEENALGTSKTRVVVEEVRTEQFKRVDIRSAKRAAHSRVVDVRLPSGSEAHCMPIGCMAGKYSDPLGSDEVPDLVVRPEVEIASRNLIRRHAKPL